MALPGPQQPQQLLPVQPVAADDHAVQQQHGNVESVAPGKHRIVIHVEHREDVGGKGLLARVHDRQVFREVDLPADAREVAAKRGKSVADITG